MFKKKTPKKLLEKTPLISCFSCKRLISSILEKTRLIDTKKLRRIVLAIVGVSLAVWFTLNFLLVATVNGYPINRFWLDRQLEKQAGKQVVENEISKILIVQEAKRQGVIVAADDVNKKILALEEQIKSQGADLQSLLTIQGLTKKDLEGEIYIQLLAEKTFGKDIVISDEEIANYFKDNRAQFSADSTLEKEKDQIREILVQTELRQELQAKIEELRKAAKVRYWINF